VTWDFTGTVVSSATLAAAPTVNSTLTATDAYGDSLDNVSAAAYLVVPVPSAPTNVTVVQAGDQFQVSWTPNGANPLAFVSSALTATPVNSAASVLTTNVTGSAATGLVGPLQPETTYQVTVVSTGSDGAGTFTQTVDGATLTTLFTVNDTTDWSVAVRAHNRGGWGPWSTSVRRGGL